MTNIDNTSMTHVSCNAYTIEVGDRVTVTICFGVNKDSSNDIDMYEECGTVTHVMDGFVRILPDLHSYTLVVAAKHVTILQKHDPHGASTHGITMAQPLDLSEYDYTYDTLNKNK